MNIRDDQFREIQKLGAGAIVVASDRRKYPYVLRDESGRRQHGTLVNFDLKRDVAKSNVRAN